MVSLTDTRLTVGFSVSQCADTARMALGRGSVAPRPFRNVRAGQSSSGRVGAPWDTKTLGSMLPILPDGEAGSRYLMHWSLRGVSRGALRRGTSCHRVGTVKRRARSG